MNIRSKIIAVVATTAVVGALGFLGATTALAALRIRCPERWLRSRRTTLASG